jgi:hypothetical protein
MDRPGWLYFGFEIIGPTAIRFKARGFSNTG